MGPPHRPLCTASSARTLSRLLLPLLVTQLWGEAGNRAWREVPRRMCSHHQPPRTAPPLGTPAPTSGSRGGSGLIPPCPAPLQAPRQGIPTPALSLDPDSFLPAAYFPGPLLTPAPLCPILSPPLLTHPASPQSCPTALALTPLSTCCAHPAPAPQAPSRSVLAPWWPRRVPFPLCSGRCPLSPSVPVFQTHPVRSPNPSPL